MKRSEILSVIRVELRYHFGQYEEVNEKAKVFSEELLNTLELLGMLPPKHFNTEEEPNLDGLNGWEEE